MKHKTRNKFFCSVFYVLCSVILLSPFFNILPYAELFKLVF